MAGLVFGLVLVLALGLALGLALALAFGLAFDLVFGLRDARADLGRAAVRAPDLYFLADFADLGFFRLRAAMTDDQILHVRFPAELCGPAGRTVRDPRPLKEDERG
jgi:hypothetical protein